jgi:hypothetical protein
MAKKRNNMLINLGSALKLLLSKRLYMLGFLVSFFSSHFLLAQTPIAKKQLNWPKLGLDSSRMFTQPLQGMVYSLQNAEPIIGASVYEKEHRKATLTLVDGSFELYLGLGKRNHQIFISKQGYADTSFFIANQTQVEHRLFLRKIDNPTLQANPMDSGSTQTYNLLRENMYNWHAKNEHYNNIKDTFHAVYVFSLLPGISTNHQVDLLTRNEVAINFLLGQSMGANKLEMGILFNQTLGEVKGLQIAALGNLAEKDVFGSQIGGLANINLNRTHGLQAASLYNYSHSFNGVQASVGLNQCHAFNGLQIGLINISDSAYGMPIGLLSYAKDGYHKKEIGLDERAILSYSYRTGKELFYNIFQVGFTKHSGRSIGLIGMGFGTLSPFEGKMKLGFDCTFSQLIPFGSKLNSLNWFGKLLVSFIYPINSKVEVFAGPAISVTALNRSDPAYSTHFRTFPLSSFYSSVDGDYTIKSWIGARLGVRFQ